MKPVLILQHLSADGPAYLAQWLACQGIAARVVNTEAGEVFPESLAAFGALAILGGEMSANDAMPSLRRAEGLFLEALRDGVPTLGHCLGGQLMARALGATIGASPAPEVGFQPMQLHPGPACRAWLGDEAVVPVFHWHYEAFALPRGAQWLASSEACPHQAFTLGPGEGVHLAMQFHIELDAEKLARWSGDEGERYTVARAQHGTVHGGARMRSDGERFLQGHQRLAERVYSRWIELARARGR